MLNALLKELGLNPKEQAVYLALLSTGSTSASVLSKKTNLNRTSVYDILNSLEEKGFSSFTLEENKKHFQATSPDNLLVLFKEKEKFLEESIPELNVLIKSSAKKPHIEVFIGKRGIKSLFEDILRNAKSFDYLGSKKHLSKLFEFYIPHFVERRKKKGIKVRIISDEIPFDTKAPYKIIKKPFKTATWLYADTLIMTSLEESEPIGVLIREKNFCDSQKIMFDLIWDSLS